MSLYKFVALHRKRKIGEGRGEGCDRGVPAESLPLQGMAATGFRFCDAESMDITLLDDMKALRSLTSQQLSDVVQLCLDFLSSSDAAALSGGVTEFGEKHGITLNELRTTLRALLLFLKAAARKHLSQAFVQEDLVRFGLSEDSAAAVARQWHSHSLLLSRVIADQTLTANKLVDMDWRFGVSPSSSELQEVGQTFLELRLQVDKGGGHREATTMQLSLPQFYDFIQEMEKAKASMEFLS